jgi:hypothetical protein
MSSVGAACYNTLVKEGEKKYRTDVKTVKKAQAATG